MEGVVKSDIGTLRTRLDELEDAYYNPPEPEEEEEEQEGSTAVTA